MKHAVYIYRKFTPNIKRPSISLREVHPTKKEAQASAEKWRQQIKEENKKLPKGWGASFVRVRPIKSLRAMRKRSLTPYPAKRKKPNKRKKRNNPCRRR